MLALTLMVGCGAGATPPAAPGATAGQQPAAAQVGGPGGEPKTIRIALPSVSMNFLHPEVANEAGLAAAEGLAFEVSHAQQGTNTAVASLVAGQIDYIYAFESTVGAALRGADLRAFMIVQQAAPFVLVATPDIRSIQDLRGQAIGHSGPVSSAAFVLRQMLDKSGLPPTSYTLLSSGSEPERILAMQTGNIKATLMSPPFHRTALQAGMHAVANAFDFDLLSPNGLGATTARLQERPDEVRAVIRTFLQTTDWMKAHPEQMVDSFQKRYAIDEPTARESYELFMQSLSATGVLSPGQIDSIASRWREMSELPPDADVTQPVDFSLVEEVARQPR
jgi:ABC-type nitrate/sulfonate/bicarbonate transport system substrate-binding protein